MSLFATRIPVARSLKTCSSKNFLLWTTIRSLNTGGIYVGHEYPKQSPSPAPRPRLAAIERNYMSRLPWQTLLRTYVIMSISSFPSLLAFSTAMIQKMLRARSALFDVDRNRLLNWFLKQTFYKQFCAGENAVEVSKTIDDLRQQGSRVMLEYAKEVLEGGSQQNTAQIKADIDQWRKGVLRTIAMVSEGDMVALK